MNKMKKIVFATQVFSLLAMLPLVAILEINHGMADGSRNYFSGIERKPAKREMVLPVMIKGERPGNSIPLMLETFFLQKVF